MYYHSQSITITAAQRDVSVWSHDLLNGVELFIISSEKQHLKHLIWLSMISLYLALYTTHRKKAQWLINQG